VLGDSAGMQRPPPVRAVHYAPRVAPWWPTASAPDSPACCFWHETSPAFCGGVDGGPSAAAAAWLDAVVDALVASVKGNAILALVGIGALAPAAAEQCTDVDFLSPLRSVTRIQVSLRTLAGGVAGRR
jgi:hypothetical protein